MTILRLIKSIVMGSIFLVISYVVIDLIYDRASGHGFAAMMWGVLGVWVLVVYFTLPRIHRLLTKLYLPDYYIGRTKTGDGLLSDPINLAFNGTKKDIMRAMKKAGWVQAEPLSLRSRYAMIVSSIRRQSYPTAPVSSLFLFGVTQDFTFQQEVGGTTLKRHHIRFWKTPDGWLLPGGARADWLAAATYDRVIGVSAFTLQITHKIEADLDKERDYIVSSVVKANKTARVKVVKNFSSSYHSRNGGGDRIHTDGAMPFITI